MQPVCGMPAAMPQPAVFPSWYGPWEYSGEEPYSIQSSHELSPALLLRFRTLRMPWPACMESCQRSSVSRPTRSVGGTLFSILGHLS